MKLTHGWTVPLTVKIRKYDSFGHPVIRDRAEITHDERAFLDNIRRCKDDVKRLVLGECSVGENGLE